MRQDPVSNRHPLPLTHISHLAETFEIFIVLFNQLIFNIDKFDLCLAKI